MAWQKPTQPAKDWRGGVVGSAMAGGGTWPGGQCQEEGGFWAWGEGQTAAVLLTAHFPAFGKRTGQGEARGHRSDLGSVLTLLFTRESVSPFST